jgi:hypothetical protein
LVFSACKKDSKILGAATQPGSDALNAEFDGNTPVYAYTQKQDSTVSYNTRYKFLGSNNDPYFGRTDIGLYLNANMQISNLNIGTSASVTSAEIVLAVDPFNSMGNINSTINYSLYTIDSSLISTRAYYTSNTRLHKQGGLNTTSSSAYGQYNGVQAIRIPVDKAFANNMMQDLDNLTNNDKYLAKYKGFYIQCSVSNGSMGVIYRCDLESDISGFYVNYKGGNSVDSVFKFNFSGPSSARFNTVKTDYNSATPIFKNQLSGDTASGSQALFLKGLRMTKVKVMMPTLKNYADSFKVAVNRAELRLYVDRTDFPVGGGTIYNLPPSLTLLPIDSTGNISSFMLDERNTTDLARYGGILDSSSSSFNYTFNIARHVQAILSGKKKNYGFYLVVANPDPTYTALYDTYIERVALYGSGRGALKPAFNLSFVKFKKD